MRAHPSQNQAKDGAPSGFPILCGRLLADVLGADVVGCEEAQEGRACRSRFDRGTAVGFFALHNADNGSDGHAGIACGFDGDDGGCAGEPHTRTR